MTAQTSVISIPSELIPDRPQPETSISAILIFEKSGTAWSKV